MIRPESLQPRVPGDGSTLSPQSVSTLAPTPLQQDLQNYAETLAHHLNAAWVGIWTANDGALEFAAAAGLKPVSPGPAMMAFFAQIRQPFVSNTTRFLAIKPGWPRPALPPARLIRS
jgi:hypothetical protein